MHGSAPTFALRSIRFLSCHFWRRWGRGCGSIRIPQGALHGVGGGAKGNVLLRHHVFFSGVQDSEPAPLSSADVDLVSATTIST
eukprot:Skav213118  [mRNA]  locus=scaffold107:71938:77772:- [translate_table: standard]